MSLEELDLERLTVGRCRSAADHFVNAEEIHPLFALRIIGGDLGVEILRNAVERNAVLCLHHELLLEPQPLLEVLELSQERDDLARDATDHLDLGEILLDARR